MNNIYKDISNHSAYALGYIDESADDLIIQYNKSIPQEVEKFHPYKKSEFLGTRLLLENLCHYMKIPYHGIKKDEFGKPHLINTNSHISITHSYPYICCMLNKAQPCGIDLEKPRDQLKKIQHKFLNKKEQDVIGDNTDLLCQYWCAKEALYKIYGRKKVTFAQNLLVYHDGENTFSGEIEIDGFARLYNLKSELIDGHYLVYNI